MTENQLCKGLHTYLSPAVLPERRRQDLLRQIRSETPLAREKGDANMFRPTQARIALIAALVVMLLTATFAVATGFSGYVNYRGEPVKGSTPSQHTAEDEKLTQRMTSLLSASPKDQYTHVFPTGNASATGITGGPVMEISALEDILTLMPVDFTLPKSPQGYTFSHGNVHLRCAADGAYELISEEVRKDGLTRLSYRIPEDKQVATIANYVLKAEDRSSITVTISLEFSGAAFFNVDHAINVQTPDIPGMKEAILFTRPASTRLMMRRPLQTPITVVDTMTLLDEQGPSTMQLVSLSVIVHSATVPADILLGMFPD